MTTITFRGLRTASLFQHHASPYAHTALFRPASSLRFASTSATTTTTSPPSQKGSKVNGPISTLPAPLTIPAQLPGQSYFPSYLFSLGKAYIGFYKTGVKNIYYNFQAARPIQTLVDKKYNFSLSSAVSANALTRSELQLLVRNWHDMKRVPAFALVLIICGEFTPLVVIALTGIVPWTCRIPKQIDADRRKLEARRSISFRNLTAPPPERRGVELLERMQLLHISWSLGLSSKAWDWLGSQYPGLPNFILRKRVQNRIEYLEMDDRLIVQGGGVGDMEIEEVRMALVERGVNVLGRGDKELKGDLSAWLKSAEKVPVEKLLLTRYEFSTICIGEANVR
jgi:hypothetical protein